MQSIQVPDNLGMYVSVITGVLLTISETLPYIKDIKSNGIIQYIIEVLSKKSANMGHVERDPLLLDNIHQQIKEIQKQLEELTNQRVLINDYEKDKKITIVIESLSQT